MFATLTCANSLSRHVKEINDSLHTLMNSRRIHPDLVNWSDLVNALDKLRKMAVQISKEILLQNNADIFPL